MRKCVLDKIDSFLARLEWRNTPSETIGLSTADILFERKTKTRLTLSTRNLQAKDSAVHQKNTSNYLAITMTQRKCRNYMLETLKIRPFGKWERKNLGQKHKNTENGRVYRRNRKHLRLSREPFSKEDPPQNTNLFPHVNRDYLAANAATNRNNYKRKPFYQKHRSHLSRMHKIRQTKSFTEYSIHRIGQATYQEWTRNQNSTEISRF